MIRRSFLKACAAGPSIFAFALVNRKTEAVVNREGEPEDVIVSVDRGDKGLLFDVNGREVKDCIEANLTTGRCFVYELDRNGKKFVRRDAASASCVLQAAKMWVCHPAPMRFEPYT